MPTVTLHRDQTGKLAGLSDRDAEAYAKFKARVIQARGVDLILSGGWRKKESKRCAIRKAVGRDSPEPASETMPTPTESSARRQDGFIPAQGTMRWEALATFHRI